MIRIKFWLHIGDLNAKSKIPLQVDAELFHQYLYCGELSTFLVLLLICPYIRLTRYHLLYIKVISVSYLFEFLFRISILFSNSNNRYLAQKQVFGAFSFSPYFDMKIYVLIAYDFHFYHQQHLLLLQVALEPFHNSLRFVLVLYFHFPVYHCPPNLHYHRLEKIGNALRF